MPLATLVRRALPSILARMISCRGPHMFFEMTLISIGTGSGAVPEKTVQATAFMPGLTSASLRISTLPALGRAGGGSDGYRGSAAATKSVAARKDFMEMMTPVALIVLLTKKKGLSLGYRVA